MFLSSNQLTSFEGKQSRFLMPRFFLISPLTNHEQPVSIKFTLTKKAFQSILLADMVMRVALVALAGDEVVDKP